MRTKRTSTTPLKMPSSSFARSLTRAASIASVPSVSLPTLPAHQPRLSLTTQPPLPTLAKCTSLTLRRTSTPCCTPSQALLRTCPKSPSLPLTPTVALKATPLTGRPSRPTACSPATSTLKSFCPRLTPRVVSTPPRPTRATRLLLKTSSGRPLKRPSLPLARRTRACASGTPASRTARVF